MSTSRIDHRQSASVRSRVRGRSPDATEGERRLRRSRTGRTRGIGRRRATEGETLGLDWIGLDFIHFDPSIARGGGRIRRISTKSETRVDDDDGGFDVVGADGDDASSSRGGATGRRARGARSGGARRRRARRGDDERDARGRERGWNERCACVGADSRCRARASRGDGRDVVDGGGDEVAGGDELGARRARRVSAAPRSSSVGRRRWR